MNVLLTNRCNRGCSFCFAQDIKNEDYAYISMQNVQYILDFLKRSDHTKFKMLGGEPSTHPRFIQIAELAASQGFDVIVLTNGFMSAAKVEALAAIDKLHIMCNISPNSQDTAKQIAQREHLFTILHDKVTLSLTVVQPMIDIDRLVNIINEFKLLRTIRMGVAQPMAGCTNNDHLHPRNYRMFGKVVHDTIMYVGSKHNIQIAADCGLTYCMFPEHDSGQAAAKSMTMCKPVMDVDHDLRVYYCLPLYSTEYLSLRAYQTRDEVSAAFDALYAKYSDANCMDECIDCSKRELCTKGCIAHKINNLL